MPLEIFASTFRFHVLPLESRLCSEMPLVTQFIKKSAKSLKPKSLFLLSQEPANGQSNEMYSLDGFHTVVLIHSIIMFNCPSSTTNLTNGKVLNVK
jgi:hypothetical protein